MANQQIWLGVARHMGCRTASRQALPFLCLTRTEVSACLSDVRIENDVCFYFAGRVTSVVNLFALNVVLVVPIRMLRFLQDWFLAPKRPGILEAFP